MPVAAALEAIHCAAMEAEIAESLVRDDAVTAVAHAMREHATSSDVSASACSCFQVLCQTTLGLEALRRIDGVRLIHQALTRDSWNPSARLGAPANSMTLPQKL